MRPADQSHKAATASGSARIPMNPSGAWPSNIPLVAQSNYGHMSHQLSGSAFIRGHMPVPSPELPLSGQRSQMNFGDFQGNFLTSQAPVGAQNRPHVALPYHGSPLPNADFGQLMGSAMNRSGFPAGMESTESLEERKRLAQLRQQSKIKQSFQESKNRSLNPDDLMGKIFADFGPTTTAEKAPTKSLDRREVQSRPATPLISPVLGNQRDRSGSLTTVSPQTLARPREPLSEPLSQARQAHETTHQPAKKPDISDLMMKLSDLSTTGSSSRKTFATAPAHVAQVPVMAKPAAFFNHSQSAVDWKSLSSDLSSAFTEAPATGLSDSGHLSFTGQADLPPWCSDVSSLPAVYRSVVQHFKNQPISKIAALMVFSRSGLSTSTLEHIWTAACRTKENFLSRNELCAALGLIGLAQTNFDVQHLTVAVLRRIPNPPEPSFLTSPPPMHMVQPVTTPFPYNNAAIFTEQNVPAASPFHDIPLSFGSTASVMSPAQSHEEEEFAEFVSAVPVQHEKVEQQHASPVVTLPKPVSLIPANQMAPKKERQHSVEDQGWGDWAQPAIPAPVASSQKPTKQQPPETIVFRPEMIGRSFDNRPLQVMSPPSSGDFASPPARHVSPQVVSLKPVTADAFVVADPYAALRDLVPESEGKGRQFEGLTADFPAKSERKSSNFSDFRVESPQPGLSGDELSVQSLEFGNFNSVSMGDLAGVSFDDAASFSATESVPNLVLDSLDLDVQNDLNSETLESNGASAGLDHADVWLRTLQACSGLLEEACAVFNSVDDSAMLMKVLGRAAEHIQNLTEVYRVARRVYIGARSTGFMEDQTVVNAIKTVEEAWTDFTTFLSMAGMEPPPGSMDFSKADLSAQSPPLSSVCGICLLDVDAKSRTRKSQTDGIKIEHEGRFYHVACANFWVNCVDLRLPCLTYKS